MLVSRKLKSSIEARLLPRLAGSRDEAARYAQAIGLSAAARLARRALGEPRGPDGELASWQRATLDATLARLCRYDDPELPHPDACGALDAALGFIAQMPPQTRQQLADLLAVFEAGVMVLGPERAAGRFTRLTPDAQDAYITSWEQSLAPPMRAAFLGLKAACMMGYWTRPAAWPAISYAINPHPRSQT